MTRLIQTVFDIRTGREWWIDNDTRQTNERYAVCREVMSHYTDFNGRDAITLGHTAIWSRKELATVKPTKVRS